MVERAPTAASAVSRAARRWATKLGFANEGLLECAARDGGDMIRFARINRENVR